MIKNRKIIIARNKIIKNKMYNLMEAIILSKKIAYAKFIESIDLNLTLDINIKQNIQLIKGFIILPYKIITNIYKILLFTKQSNINLNINENNPNIKLTIGNIELINKIKLEKKINFNLLIATNDIMSELKQIASILGPKGLMPSNKFNTLTTNIQKTINEIPYQVKYQLNEGGNILVKIGNLQLNNNEINNNIIFFIKTFINKHYKLIKKINLTKISLSSTMGPNIFINPNNIVI